LYLNLISISYISQTDKERNSDRESKREREEEWNVGREGESKIETQMF
jgi:hypothetical protein